MKYDKKIILKNGKECDLRNGDEGDGQAVSDNFNLTQPKRTICFHIPKKTVLTLNRKMCS